VGRKVRSWRGEESWWVVKEVIREEVEGVKRRVWKKVVGGLWKWKWGWGGGRWKEGREGVRGLDIRRG
jgi:hypothetical protein